MEIKTSPWPQIFIKYACNSHCNDEQKVGDLGGGGGGGGSNVLFVSSVMIPGFGIIFSSQFFVVSQSKSSVFLFPKKNTKVNWSQADKQLDFESNVENPRQARLAT